MSECISSNTVGSNAVFNFCLKHNIKLIYSATSASCLSRSSESSIWAGGRGRDCSFKARAALDPDPKAPCKLVTRSLTVEDMSKLPSCFPTKKSPKLQVIPTL